MDPDLLAANSLFISSVVELIPGMWNIHLFSLTVHVQCSYPAIPGSSAKYWVHQSAIVNLLNDSKAFFTHNYRCRLQVISQIEDDSTMMEVQIDPSL